MYPYISYEQITVGCIFVGWTPPRMLLSDNFQNSYFQITLGCPIPSLQARMAHTYIDDTCIIFYSIIQDMFQDI